VTDIDKAWVDGTAMEIKCHLRWKIVNPRDELKLYNGNPAVK